MACVLLLPFITKKHEDISKYNNLFPGEEENIDLNFTATTPCDWSISFKTNPSEEFETEFGLNETQLIGDSGLTTTIHLKALPNAKHDMHLIPITASAILKGVTLSQPSEFQPSEFQTDPDDVSRTYNETEYLKVIVSEPNSTAVPPAAPVTFTIPTTTLIEIFFIVITAIVGWLIPSIIGWINKHLQKSNLIMYMVGRQHV